MTTKTHEQRMAAKKAVIDAKSAKATEERGVTILLRGNGKGKSSSAFGTLMRTLGHGKTGAVVQFVKGRIETGVVVVPGLVEAQVAVRPQSENREAHPSPALQLCYGVFVLVFQYKLS